MSDEILSEQEREHWFAILCRSDAPFHHLYAAEEKLRLHERALLADRDRLAARVATLEAALREVLDAILTPSDPASDQLPVPEQTTPEPEPDRHPHETMMEAAHAEALPDLLRIANSRRSGHTVGSEPDRCPTCGSDDRNVRGEEGFDAAEGTPYEGQGYIAFGTCSDRWHGAPGGES